MLSVKTELQVINAANVMNELLFCSISTFFTEASSIHLKGFCQSCPGGEKLSLLHGYGFMKQTMGNHSQWRQPKERITC